MLDALAYEFFQEFARYEYCLKVTGLRKDSRTAQACWVKYASEVSEVINAPKTEDLSEAISYFEKYPPKRQVVKDDVLDWDDTLPKHKNKAELILRLVCRVRNNLFHGGKFNGNWFEPERSEQLIRHALVILRACAENHEKVRRAYAGSEF